MVPAHFFTVRYSPPGAWWLRWTMGPLCYFGENRSVSIPTCSFETLSTFSGMVCMVISGVHYTMDVLVAYWLGSHMFAAYHAVFEAAEPLRHQHPAAWIWWYVPLCCFFPSPSIDRQ